MLNKEKNIFQQEQNDLLKTILDNRFFIPWKERYQMRDCCENDELSFHLSEDSHLEIYLSAKCNQNCEYCYLIKNKGLYPEELDNKENVLKNLAIFFNYLIGEEFCIKDIEYFTGEIWHTQYGLDVLELTLEAIENGLQIERVTIPSNCSFILSDPQMHKIQRYINKFNEIGTPLTFSISIDGKVLEEKTRPLNSKKSIKDDDFYDKLFTFAQHNNFFFHPMVSSVSCKDWIENYKWWKEKCEEYDFFVNQAVMMLEVRNNDWTDETIDDYNNFMKYLIDSNIEELGGVEEFADALFTLTDKYEGYFGGYIPFGFGREDTFAGCSVSNSLTVRIGDLAICPCHRTAYNKYLYGKFVVENDEIVDIEALNPQMAVRILMANNNIAHHGCDVCPFAPYCLKGCFGSQLEITQDPFMPVENVCYFFKRKWTFLIDYYEKLGVLNILRNNLNPYHHYYPEWLRMLKFAEAVKENGVGKY